MVLIFWLGFKGGGGGVVSCGSEAGWEGGFLGEVLDPTKEAGVSEMGHHISITLLLSTLTSPWEWV